MAREEINLQNEKIIYDLSIGDVIEMTTENGSIVRGEIISILSLVKEYWNDEVKGAIEWRIYEEFQQKTSPDIIFVTYLKWIFENPKKYKISKKDVELNPVENEQGTSKRSLHQG